MQHPDDIARFLGEQPYIMRLLAAVEELGIDDCWIGAGLIRNAVWDHLHGQVVGPVAGSDVDVVYCDPGDASASRDLTLEGHLHASHPDVPWSVHNQVRMHLANGDPPYRDVADALRCWPETATAVAARIHSGSVEVLAPHGVGDLVGLIVRPTPVFAGKREVYRVRQAKKNWRRRWPRLRSAEAR
jgi:uncharacterized protein